jgi:hypothetical protein
VIPKEYAQACQYFSKKFHTRETATYNHGTSDRNVLGNQFKRIDGRQRLFWCADEDEVAAGSKERQITAQGHVLVIFGEARMIIMSCKKKTLARLSILTTRANDQVQRSSIWLEVVFTAPMSCNEPGCTHLLGIGFLALTVRDRGNVGT